MRLALDLGTTTGWAADDGVLTSGTVNLKPRRFEGGGMRFLRFKGFLTEIKGSAGPVEEVCFEEVRRHAGTDAAHIYGGLLGILTAWCEHHQIPYRGIPVGEIKRSFTGKGNANKEAMIAAARARGHEPQDDNEADAIAIAYWRRSQP